MLKNGQIVRGPQFPETVEIKSIQKISGEYYQVEALGRQSQKYYEIILGASSIQSIEILNDSRTNQNLTARDMQHYIQYIILKLHEQYSVSFAAGSKNLIPLPHQIEAVYSRMLQVPNVRFLLADDPGAGKTIMAGMLIKELLARHTINRVLIMVPPLVLKQWQDELYEKFNLSFSIINRSVIRNSKANPFEQYKFSLTSIYWAPRDDIKNYIIESDYDLIIVDEAHKMAAYTHGKIKRKTAKTKMYQLGEAVLKKVPHCLLLTATPHKGDEENFRHLMSLIDYDIFANIRGDKSLREMTNPFIVRRLKENLKKFDGTPLFPKRTTKTVQYELSNSELELYEAITEYVRTYFNLAIDNGKNSTAFAMMLLQRRLSSSLQAIHLSLERRRNRLIELKNITIAERKKLLNEFEKTDITNIDDQSLEYQQEIEGKLEQAVFLISIEEIEIEIQQLSQLINKVERVKLSTIERKYQELERTLFGINGLLKNGEKVIIFTEHVDTLLSLKEKLHERIPKIAVIMGKYPINKRREQVELFKTDDYPVMLATDAGGESINLQFCNQMINYDIPWNPNKLEQRMGRIHRIGQKNEVFVFNLVAKNTREGNVLSKLLQKMDQMRRDLGSDRVYDFIGEILEGKDSDLSALMQKAIMQREKLDDIINSMDKKISEEYKKLLEITQQQSVVKEVIDLPGMRTEQNNRVIENIHKTAIAKFCEYALSRHNVRIYNTHDSNVKRIDRFPKRIRDFAFKNNILINENSASYKFTGNENFSDNEVDLLDFDSPIYKLVMELTNEDLEKHAFESYIISAPIQEEIGIYMFNVSIIDGTGKELDSRLVCLGQRKNGDIVEISLNYFFNCDFMDINSCSIDMANKSKVKLRALKLSEDLKNKIFSKRQYQLLKMEEFLDKTFSKQYADTVERLHEYQINNSDNKNIALINQMNSQLIDIEIRKNDRLVEIQRQKNISFKPPKLLFTGILCPSQQTNRVINNDYYDIVTKYEQENGRRKIKKLPSLGAVDFYSERFNGEPRYIIVTNNENTKKSDLIAVSENLECFVYYIDISRNNIKEI